MDTDVRRSVDAASARRFFDELLAAVEAGETIEITRDGAAVAFVSPAAPPQHVIDVDWLQRMTDAMPYGAPDVCDAVGRRRDAERY